MDLNCYLQICRMETTSAALEDSVSYLSENLRFLQKHESVLICFPNVGHDSLGALFGEAVQRCGAVPIYWGPDYRWRELLRLGFDSRINTIIGHPLVILGLMKISKATGTPLYAHNVVLGGYPYDKWMAEGIKKGLDCRIRTCYALRSGPVITGFSCTQEAGIHIREDLFDVITLDDQGNEVPDYKHGRLKFVYKKDRNLILDPEEMTLLSHQRCSCGVTSPRILETSYVGQSDPSKSILEDQFLTWSSVLDYRAKRTDHGVHLELVHFPGESLPKLPSCAKLTLRPWNPEEDIPFYIQDNFLKIPEKER